MSPILAAALARAEASDACAEALDARAETAVGAVAPLSPGEGMPENPGRYPRLSGFPAHPIQRRGGRRS